MNQTFERRYNLRVHMRRHTGETPYPCKQPGCSQMFKWRSSLAHHMKTRHQVNVVSTQMQKSIAPTSPGAITDVRTATNVLSSRMVPYSVVESPAGSSSFGSPTGTNVVRHVPHSCMTNGRVGLPKPSLQHHDMTQIRDPSSSNVIGSVYGGHNPQYQGRPGHGQHARDARH